MLKLLACLLAAVALIAFAGPAVAEEKVIDNLKVVKAGDGKITVSDAKGQEHSAGVASDAKITVDGKDTKLGDLKVGLTIKVTLNKDSGNITVTKIEGKS